MSERDSALFASLSTDELGWLNAYSIAIQDPSPDLSSPRSNGHPIARSKSQSSSPITSSHNDSLTLLRVKGMPRRRHHYQASTKSSVAKAVRPHGILDVDLDPFSYHAPLHPSLRCSTDTAVPDNSSKSTSSQSLSPLSNSSSPLTPTAKREAARVNAHITMPVNEHESTPRPSKQEWIYRRPKTPPLSSSFSSPSQTSLLSRTSTRRSTISGPTRPIQITVVNPSPDELPESSHTPFWASRISRSLERPRKMALPRLSVEGRRNISVSSSIPESPTDISPPSSPSSRLQTPSPTSSISHPIVRTAKSHPRHRDISFDSTSSMGTSMGPMSSCPSKSILSRSMPERSQQRFFNPVGRKNSTATSCSGSYGSKSVKFVEEPIVHYAIIGAWDGDDISEADLEIQDLNTSPHYTSDIEITNGSSNQVNDSMDVEMSLEIADEPSFDDSWAANTPEPIVVRANTPPPKIHKPRGSSLSKLPTLKRKLQPHRTSSPAKARGAVTTPSKIPRTQISGPFALGSHQLSTVPPSTPTVIASRTLPSSFMPNSPKPTKPSGGVSLRSAPSIESLRSSKSAGAKSTRSLRSLRSLPGSIKSSFSANSKGLKGWFKDRMMGVDVGVVG